MNASRVACCLLVIGIAGIVPPGAAAQVAAPAPPQPPATVPAPAPSRPPATAPAPAPAAPAVPQLPPDIADSDDRPDGDERSVVRIGQDYSLPAGDTAHDAVVIMGNATIDGRIDDDLVVILGAVRIASTAVIAHDVAIIGGGVTVDRGAAVGHDFVVVGGTANIPPDFSPGGEHVVIGAGLLGLRFESVLPWFTRGLLWGRPLVPELPWMWAVVAVFFFVYLVLNQIAYGPVGGSAAVLMEKPLTAFGSGLLVLLLLGPVCLLLAVSVVGIAVVPFVLCAVLIAAVIGKVGVMRWIGMNVLRDPSTDTSSRLLLAFVIGFVVLLVAYSIPVIGFSTWAIASVLGLGASALAFMNAYRREQPPAVVAAPATAPPSLPPAYPPAPLQYSAPPADAPPSAPAIAAPTAGAAVALGTTPAANLLLMPRAPFRDRLAAFVLDLILVVIVVRMLDVVRGGRLLFLALLVYHIGFWTWKQTTVGGMICQLRVVRVDGAPLTFADALVRGLSGIFSAVVVGLGFLWILKDPERQAWHDKIAGTYVVKVPRHFPL